MDGEFDFPEGVEIDSQGNTRNAGYAPYLDYRPLTEEERALFYNSILL